MTNPPHDPNDPADPDQGSAPNFDERVKEIIEKYSVPAPTAGPFGTAPGTIWLDTAEAVTYADIYHEEATKPAVNENVLAFARQGSERTHDRIMRKLDILEGIIKDDLTKEWIVIGLACVAFLAGLVAWLWTKGTFGASVLIAGAFTLLGYFAARKPVSTQTLKQFDQD